MLIQSNDWNQNYETILCNFSLLGAKIAIVLGNCKNATAKITGITPALLTRSGKNVERAT